jgi:P27 family predicted phage terminase small subunit
MVKGRKPIPSAVKRLRGNPGKKPLNRSEPQPIGDLPECPSHLAGRAREAWYEFAGGLEGIATRLDATALELLCTAYGGYLDCMAKVAQGGPVWIGKAKDGGLPFARISPYMRVAADQWRKVKEMLTEFGMTPSSRTRLHVVPADGDGDGFEEFIQGKR